MARRSSPFTAARARRPSTGLATGQTLCLSDMHDASVIERLAQRLSRLHRASVDVPTATSPFERFYGFEQRAIEGGRPWPQAMTRAAEFVRRLEEELQHTTPRPCHLDLHARNIILPPAQDPVFIDWVNGGLSDPVSDVATIIAFLGLRDGQRDHFLASYQKSMGEALDIARLELLMPIRPFVAAASSLVNTPLDVSQSQLEQELARAELPGHELYSIPHSARPEWPRWKWGLIALKMGLSPLP